MDDREKMDELITALNNPRRGRSVSVCVPAYMCVPVCIACVNNYANKD